MSVHPEVLQYESLVKKILPTGSRVICHPAPDKTDEDYMILLTPDQRQTFEARLNDDGWVLGGSLPNYVIDTTSGGIPVDDWTLNKKHEFKDGMIDQARLFHSWKRREFPEFIETLDGGEEHYHPPSGTEINLLVTCNEQYFDDFTRATFLCRGLNLTDKSDRVLVFKALTTDIWPTGEEKRQEKSVWKNGSKKYTLQYTYPGTGTEAHLAPGQLNTAPPDFPWNSVMPTVTHS